MHGHAQLGNGHIASPAVPMYEQPTLQDRYQLYNRYLCTKSEYSMNVHC